MKKKMKNELFSLEGDSEFNKVLNPKEITEYIDEVLNTQNKNIKVLKTQVNDIVSNLLNRYKVKLNQKLFSHKGIRELVEEKSKLFICNKMLNKIIAYNKNMLIFSLKRNENLKIKYYLKLNREIQVRRKIEKMILKQLQVNDQITLKRFKNKLLSCINEDKIIFNDDNKFIKDYNSINVGDEVKKVVRDKYDILLNDMKKINNTLNDVFYTQPDMNTLCWLHNCQYNRMEKQVHITGRFSINKSVQTFIRRRDAEIQFPEIKRKRRRLKKSNNKLKNKRIVFEQALSDNDTDKVRQNYNALLKLIKSQRRELMKKDNENRKQISEIRKEFVKKLKGKGGNKKVLKLKMDMANIKRKINLKNQLIFMQEREIKSLKKRLERSQRKDKSTKKKNQKFKKKSKKLFKRIDFIKKEMKKKRKRKNLIKKEPKKKKRKHKKRRNSLVLKERPKSVSYSKRKLSATSFRRNSLNT